ncbi:hypothetical protein [Bacillus sp. JJ1764]|uniref:hypothetical protein n=1 Tax=Bacillus sp. JJ1764 TaxID=3122964 RepID=UPI002FFE2AC2
MIEMIWKRIVDNEGEIFKQIRGKEFSYQVFGNAISLSTTNHQVPKSQFEKALKFVPLVNTTEIQHLRAPSYIFAILMDQRIKQNNW